MKRMLTIAAAAAAITGCKVCDCGCDCSAPKEICTEAEKAEGFKPLFDGTMEGWTFHGYGGADCYYAAGNGELRYDHTKGGGELWTDKDYADFTIRFQFLLSSDCNNGLGIRTPFGGHAATEGMEVQILDDEGNMYQTFGPQLGCYTHAYQRHGSVYGVIPSKHRPDGRSYLNPVGEWNEEEVTVKGSKIKVVLNGETILDDDLSKYPVDGTTMDGQKHPGLRNKTGRIGWLSHGYPVRWRCIRIKEL